MQMSDLSASTSLRGRCLLVVEAGYLIADELRDELIGAGAKVIGPVPTLTKALQMIGANAALGGAVLDVNLGGEKVFPFVDVLRQRGIPSVLMSRSSGRSPRRNETASARR
jgi:hypothetical protein